MWITNGAISDTELGAQYRYITPPPSLHTLAHTHSHTCSSILAFNIISTSHNIAHTTSSPHTPNSSPPLTPLVPTRRRCLPDLRSHGGKTGIDHLHTPWVSSCMCSHPGCPYACFNPLGVLIHDVSPPGCLQTDLSLFLVEKGMAGFKLGQKITDK